MDAYNPLFAFGSGLSYTSFAYEDFTVAQAGPGLLVSVTVTNTGPRPGAEVVQLYGSDLYASVTPHVQRLKGFRKVQLDPGQSVKVDFPLAADDLMTVTADGTRAFEPGAFAFRIGDRRQEVRIDADRTGRLRLR